MSLLLWCRTHRDQIQSSDRWFLVLHSAEPGSSWKWSGIKDSRRAAPIADTLYQIVENGCQTVFLRLILCQCPRHGLINIFVAAFEQCRRSLSWHLPHGADPSSRLVLRETFQERLPSGPHPRLRLHRCWSLHHRNIYWTWKLVRFTRLPRVFASSEFRRSTISSQVITPSFSNGIS